MWDPIISYLETSPNHLCVWNWCKSCKSSQSSRLPALSCLDPVQWRADHYLFHGRGAEWEGQRTRICRGLSTCHCVRSTPSRVGCVGGFWLMKQSPLVAPLSRDTAQFTLIYSVIQWHAFRSWPLNPADTGLSDSFLRHCDFVIVLFFLYLNLFGCL